MKKTRDNNYDLLRIVSCVAVIFIHVSSTYKNAITDDEVFDALMTQNIFSTVLYNTLPRFAVPCFVMLAGVFALGNDKNAEYRYYYRKTFANIGIPTLVFSVLYFMFSFIKAVAKIIIKGDDCSILLSPVNAVIKGAPYYHMWYLYMMIILYCLVPIIIRWKNEIGFRIFARISLIAMLVCTLSGWASTKIKLHWGIKSFAYLGYFLLGYTIKEKLKNKKSNGRGILMIVFGVILEIGLSFVQYQHSMQGIAEADENYSVIGPLNPVVALASICIFAGFSMLDIKWKSTAIVSRTFLIYLFHAGVWNEIVARFTKHLGFTHSYIIIPVSVVVVFAISYALSVIYEWLWGLLEAKTHITEKVCKKCFGN